MDCGRKNYLCGFIMYHRLIAEQALQHFFPECLDKYADVESPGISAESCFGSSLYWRNAGGNTAV